MFCDGEFHPFVAYRVVYAFERYLNDDQTTVIVAVNRGGADYTLYLGSAYKDMLSGRRYAEHCTIEPNGYVILQSV